MQFLNIINEILAPNKRNINFGSLNMTAENAQYIAICIAIRPCRIVSYRNTHP